MSYGIEPGKRDDDDCEPDDGDLWNEGDYEALEERHGREYLQEEAQSANSSELDAYLSETDTSCSNEELGLDAAGNREDD